MIVQRPLYTDRIDQFMDAPLIKVITGIRRAGKSTILQLLIDSLMAKGVDQGNILLINMESLEFEAIKNSIDLYEYVRARLPRHGRAYLFVDEIQNIREWERAIASILTDDLADITISGSNAGLLSSDLATRLTGRYVEIPVYPLCFSEYLRFEEAKRGVSDTQEAWGRFLRYGGFPGIHYLDLDDDPVFTYLNSLYNTIVLKDVVNRNEIREPAQLDLITRYLFDNCGKITTAKRIADYLKAQSVNASVSRVQNYITFLENAYLVYRCRRYDLRGRRHLKLYDKFYMADIGIRHGLIGYRDGDVAGLLENVVYLELRARRYTVSVGKFQDYEIDFIAENQQGRLYIQVCYLLASRETVDREYGALERIRDNYPKLILSIDTTPPADRGGIRWQNLIEFLLSDETTPG